MLVASNLEPLRLGLDEEGADAFGVLRVGVGAGEQDAEIGNGAVRDELLGAVHDVGIANAARRRREAASVAARLRLRERVAAEDGSRRQAGKVASLLRLGAEVEDGTDAQAGVGAEDDGVAGVCDSELFRDEGEADVIGARAAVQFGNRDAQQSEFAHALGGRHGKAVVAVVSRRNRGHFGTSELPHHVAHHALRLAQLELHGPARKGRVDEGDEARLGCQKTSTKLFACQKRLDVVLSRNGHDRSTHTRLPPLGAPCSRLRAIRLHSNQQCAADVVRAAGCRGDAAAGRVLGARNAPSGR